MKRLMRMLVAVTAGAGLAYFFTTPRGRAFRARGAELLRQWCAQYGSCCSDATQAADASDATSGAPDVAVRTKIDETRRRLREQLDETLAGTRSAGSGEPRP